MLDNLKRHGGRVGFPLLACLLWSQSASAEVTLVEKDGWTFYANGRVGAFVSAAFGDDFPDPTPPRGGSTHVLKGASFLGDVKNYTAATHAGGPGNGFDVGFRIVREAR